MLGHLCHARKGLPDRLIQGLHLALGGHGAGAIAEVDEVQRAVAEANVGEGHGLSADRGDRPGLGAELLQGRDITGFARLHLKLLAVAQLALPGRCSEVL